MSPDEIANRASLVIEAMRARAASESASNAFVARMLLDPAVIAAAVAAHLASIIAAVPK